jgi:hypothetical protein
MKPTIHLHIVPKSRIVKLYIQPPISLDSAVFNQVSSQEQFYFYLLSYPSLASSEILTAAMMIGT